MNQSKWLPVFTQTTIANFLIKKGLVLQYQHSFLVRCSGKKK